MKTLIPALKADAIALWLLATVSLCLGLLVNQIRDRPMPLVYQTKEERLMTTVGRITSAEVGADAIMKTVPDYIGVDEVRALVAGGKVIIVDARPEVFYRSGHIPGSISLPRDDFEAGYARRSEMLEAKKGSIIVIYCSGSSCGDSDLVRKALQLLGYNHMTVFNGGWSAWVSAGLPEERVP